ncbi:pyruvate dehydrogenase E1 component [Spirochaetota bacterium]|nr:pyruvate dehydrogenase E1 component [Spirochaetota bacterium]
MKRRLVNYPTNNVIHTQNTTATTPSNPTHTTSTKKNDDEPNAAENTEADIDIDPVETQEWTHSLHDVIKRDGIDRANFLLSSLIKEIPNSTIAVTIPKQSSAYVNTIPTEEEVPYPGDLTIERSISNAIRWNAMAMVLRANKRSAGIGGHIATYASCATIYDVAYNHFFKGSQNGNVGDSVFFQGHASPGIYARAYIEGVLSEQKIENFRRELLPGGGLSSYPHPRLVPDFWQFATVSMGLGPLMAIYHARFNKWLKNRNLKDTSPTKVIAYVGDGETDEVETLGALSIAARENLDNLLFVVNCNLQRLDGPVRGNSKIIQELEGIFRGAGWNVIKTIWSHHWDPLFEKDSKNALLNLLETAVDGDFQVFSTLSGAERRRFLFARDKEVEKLVAHFSDHHLDDLTFGGHDEQKLYNAYERALNVSNGKPTVMLIKSIKGYGMGKSGEGRNIAHQQKEMSSESLQNFKQRFNIPIEDAVLEQTPFYNFKKNSPEHAYINDLRKKLGDFIPHRRQTIPAITLPASATYERTLAGTGKRAVSSTMAFVQVLTALLRDKNLSERIVPIVPDESRTFGMEGLFRQYGIYSPSGQLYTPIDKKTLAPYNESVDGQIFQEGINEAGAISTFIAAGTSYSHQGILTIPFYVFYSMFGFQRTGDLAWAAADMQARGFLVGGTAGRTTLNGEGLQHEDGHSHILAATIPNLRAYDATFGYELATIIKNGLKAMYQDKQDCFYYLTIYNENYPHPALPTDIPDIETKIMKGLYCYKKSALKSKKQVNILASGISLLTAERASEILEKEYRIATTLYAVTSFKALREDALACERENMLHPNKTPKTSFLAKSLSDAEGGFVAVTDYMKALPDLIAPFMPSAMVSIGTDGFGRSATREELREYFEINESFIILASLHALTKQNILTQAELTQAIKKLNIDPKKPYPLNRF